MLTNLNNAVSKTCRPQKAKLFHAWNVQLLWAFFERQIFKIELLIW